MAHTNFFSSIRITPDQPLFSTKNNKQYAFVFPPPKKRKEENTMFSKVAKTILLNMFIYTENYTESHKIFEITISNAKHTQNDRICFQHSIFPKMHKFGTPWAYPIRIAFELTN